MKGVDEYMMLIGLDKSGQKSDIYHTARQERRKPKGEIQMKNKKYYISYAMFRPYSH